MTCRMTFAGKISEICSSYPSPLSFSLHVHKLVLDTDLIAYKDSLSGMQSGQRS